MICDCANDAGAGAGAATAASGLRARRRAVALVLLGCGLAGGCASDYRLEDPELGSAVRHQIAIQTAEPERGAPGLWGQKAETALKAYREDAGDLGRIDERSLGESVTGGGGGG